MKTFNKLFALLLALLTVVTMLPMSVLADAWVKVDAKTDAAGASTVTLTLDAGTLADILKKDGVSPNLLKDIAAGVSVDVAALREAFSVEELFEIVPRESWLKVFNVEEIIEKVGVDELLSYVDVDALAEKYADGLIKLLEVDALLADLGGIAGLEQYLNINELFAGKEGAVADLLTNEEKANMVEISELVKYLNTDEGKWVLGYINAAEIAKNEFAQIYDDGTDPANPKPIKASLVKKHLQEAALKQAIEDMTDKTKIYNFLDVNTLIAHGSPAFITAVKGAINTDALAGVTPQQLIDAGCIDKQDVIDALKVSYPSEYTSFIDTATETINKTAFAAVSGMNFEDYLLNEGLIDVKNLFAGDNPITTPQAALKTAQLPTVLDSLTLDELKANIKEKELVETLGTATIVGCINMTALVNDPAFDAAAVMKAINNPATYVDTKKLLGDTNFNLNRWMDLNIIKKDDVYNAVDVTEVFNEKIITFSEVLAQLDETDRAALGFYDIIGDHVSKLSIDQITSVIPMDVLMNEFSNDELVSLVQKIGVKDYIVPVLALVSDKVLANIDKVVIDGATVAEESADSLLQINSSALVKALAGIVPTLSEIEACEDGKLVSTTIEIDYTVDGTATTKSKSITFEVVVEGDLSLLRAAAGKLSALLRTYITEFSFENGIVTLDVLVPSKATSLYAKALDMDAIPAALKEKLIGLAATSGNDVLGFVEALTLDEIITIMDAIEPSVLYNKVLTNEYVQRILDKVEERTGRDLSGITLDELVSYAANVPSLERICEIIENKTGRDVMAYVETLAIKVDDTMSRAEQISAVQTILDKVEARFGVDVSALSAEQILDSAKSKAISETVLAKISARLGVDISAALDTYTVDELYQKAVDAAATKTDAFNKVKNYILAKTELIPDRLMNISVASFYTEDGLFATGKRSVSFNARELIEKAIDKVAGRFNLPTDAIELIMSRISGGESITMGVDLKVQFQDLYKITYMDRDGKTELFTAFLPVGADLSVFRNNPEVTGYDFEEWTDINGNAVEVMPADDTVVYANRNYAIVTVVDEAGNKLGSVGVYKGESLAEALLNADFAADFKAIEDKVEVPAEIDARLFDSYLVRLYNNGVFFTKNTVIDEDITLTAVAAPDYFLAFDVEVDYGVTIEGNKYILTLNGELPTEFTLNLDRAHLLVRASTEADVSFAFAVKAPTEYTFMAIANDTLAQFYNSSEAEALFTYKTGAAVADSAFADNKYYANANDASISSMFIMLDNAAFTEAFAAALDMQLYYANAIDNDPDKRTNVYTVDANGNREWANEGANAANGVVAFAAKHFSDYMIVNEVALNLTFKYQDGTTVNSWMPEFANASSATKTVVYLPANSVVALSFYQPEGSKIIDITDGTNTYEVGADFNIGNGASLVVTFKSGVYFIYYYVKGALAETVEYEKDAIPAEADLPKFTDVVKATDNPDANKYANTGKWVGLDKDLLGKANMIVFAKWDLISYTVIFEKADGNKVTVEGVTAENYTEKVTVPAIEGVPAGKVAKWGKPEISGTTATVKLVYTNLVYQVVTDSNGVAAPTQGEFDTAITVTVTQKEGYDANIVVKKADGSAVTVTDNSFKMPASNVYVSVTYTPKTLNYTINGVAATGKYGDNVTFTVTLNRGQVLKSVSHGELLSTVPGEAGSKTLTYAVALTENNLAITYAVEDTAASLFQIFNGALFNGEGDPESGKKNVVFDGWSEKVAGVLQFAGFRYEKSTSLLWLWILLAILVLIALIVLIYLLHVSGKIGVNFLTRFVCWIVGGFFVVCLAISGLGLKIAGLFGKSDKAEDYGFEGEEASEEAAEETTEETAEEATEEAAEENAEEAAVAEEAVEATEETEAPAEEAEAASEEAPAAEEAAAASDEIPVEEETEAPAEAAEAAEEAPAEEAEAPAEEAEAPAEEAEAPAEEAEAPAEEAEAPAEEATEDEKKKDNK